MVDETDKRTRVPEGSVDVLAKALGLIAEPMRDPVPPALERPLPQDRMDTGLDVRLLALESRLTRMEASFTAIDAQLGKASDSVARLETTIVALQDDIASQFRMSSRLLIGIAAGLTLLVIIGRLV